MEELRARPLEQWHAEGIYNPAALLRIREEERRELFDDAIDGFS
jgi:hypothetical protein